MSIITPPPYGRPDYSAPLDVLQGPATRVDANIPAFTKTALATVNLQGYKYLGLYSDNQNVTQDLYLDWGPNGAFFTPGEEDVFGIPAGNVPAFNMHVTARADHVGISVDNYTDTEIAVHWYWWGTNRPGASPYPAITGPIWEQNNTAQATGTTYVQINGGFQGPIAIYATCDQTFNIGLDVAILSGEWRTYWTSLGNAADAVVNTYTGAPPGMHRIWINNTSTTVAACNVAISSFAAGAG